MYQDSKRELSYIIAISAFIHILLIIFLLISKIDSSLKEYKTKLLQQKKSKKQAQVIFKEAPKKRMIPKLTAGNASAMTIPPIPKQKLEKKTEPKLKKEYKKKPKPPEKKTKPKKIHKPIIKKKPTSIVKQKIKIDKKKKIDTKKPTPKKITLKDITTGFMKFAKRNTTIKQPTSNHLVSVIGKNFGPATAEQLKHERYIKKLFDCVDVSFKFLKRSFRFNQTPRTELLKLFMFIDLNKSGQIHSFKVVESSGNKQFDTFMTKVFKDAARSFPPVPSSFNTEIYSLPIQCTIPASTLRPERKQLCV